MLDGYYYFVLLQQVALKEGIQPQGYQVHDVALTAIFAAAYCSAEDQVLVFRQLVQVVIRLEQEQQGRSWDVAPIRGNYGLDSVVPLAAFFAAQNGHGELAQLIRSHCHVQVAEPYRQAMDELYTEDPVMRKPGWKGLTSTTWNNPATTIRSRSISQRGSIIQ